MGQAGDTGGDAAVIDPARTAAVVLVGGQGSRLRPLTLGTPKPMLPTAGVPFLAHLLSRIATAGIRRVVLGTAYRAEVFEAFLGEGGTRGLDGLELECCEEPEPLGTGGGIRFAAEALGPGYDEVVVFNGDILSGVDVRRRDRRAPGRGRRRDAAPRPRRPTPRAFGCVPTDADGRVNAFLEKTPAPPTDQVNAGCYVFRREVVDTIPAGRPVSVERETFPGLLTAGARLQGHVESSYWLDLGTPASFVRGSADLVQGAAPTAALPGPVGTALLLPGAEVAPSASLTDGTTVGAGVQRRRGQPRLGLGAHGRRADRRRRARRAVGDRAGRDDRRRDRGARRGGRRRRVDRRPCELLAGVRIWPGLVVPDGGLRFSGGA